jgi:hypothetical protein
VAAQYFEVRSVISDTAEICTIGFYTQNINIGFEVHIALAIKSSCF